MEKELLIKINKCKTQYEYKNIDFLVSTFPKKRNLVVFFHGGRCGANLPIFRGYNYSFDDSNILSFSDPNLKYYSTNIGWYLNTTEHPTTRNDIIFVINQVKKLTNPVNIVFVAQCSGALIALQLACMYNEYAFITNPHLILKSLDCTVYNSWTDTPITNKYNNVEYLPLKKILDNKNESITSHKDLDIRNALKGGLPKNLIIYAHRDDYTSEWILKVKEFYMKINQLDKCCVYLHDTVCKSPHHCPLPNNSSLSDYLDRYFKTI